MNNLDLQQVEQFSHQEPIVSVDLVRAFERSDYQPEGWTQDDARHALKRYQKFLRLAAKMKGSPLSPTRDIDFMWHLHMLHPKAYLADCTKLFGQIFDHDGGYGKGEGEEDKLKKVFFETARLWEGEYGESYVVEPQLQKCWHNCQSRCWHACKNEH